MKLESVHELKQQLLAEVVAPFAARASQLRAAGARALAAKTAGSPLAEPLAFGVGARPFDKLPQLQRSLALGVALHKRSYRLAIRVQRPSLLHSPMVESMRKRAKGEIDIRMIGRIDKRTKRKAASRRRVSARPAAAPAAAVVPWYRTDVRPLLIGASVGHVDVTAGSIGGFVTRAARTCILSNNHVLANENAGPAGAEIVQRGRFDGGQVPAELVATLDSFVRLKTSGANLVDAALGEIDDGIAFDASRLRDLDAAGDGRLSGLGPETLDTGATVRKIGRTTGPTTGRVTAFAIDNVVVSYDLGNIRFDDQIEIEGAGTTSFSDGGDSGSLIVNEDSLAVALLFAGGDTGGTNGMGLTYANPIHTVLNALKATLLF